MIPRDYSFFNIRDPGLIARMSRSQEIRVLNRFEFFEAVNTKNGNRYKVQVEAGKIKCTCHDSNLGRICKHEIAVRRDIELFEVMT